MLFPGALRPGGMYIVEDVESSYWRWGQLSGAEVRAGFRHPSGSIVEAFKDVADAVNGQMIVEPRDVAALSARLRFVDRVRSVTFAPNCVMLVKKTGDDQLYEQPYPFPQHLRASPPPPPPPDRAGA